MLLHQKRFGKQMTVPLVTMAKIIIWCVLDQILESFKVLGMQFKSITHITKSVHLQSYSMPHASVFI
jgi:hypothetical protein